MSQFEYKESDRRKLPHIQPPGATMFVTFRLAGSLPIEIVNALMQEREHHERQLLQIRDKQEQNRLAALEEKRFFAKWDYALDAASNGPHWLEAEPIAKVVVDSLHYHHAKRYALEAFCVMPNHVHLVYTPLSREDKTYYPLSSIMHTLKRYTATRANEILMRKGDFWQHENYDRYARDEKEFRRIVNYVLNNPVKAGLVAKPEDWKWSFVGQIGNLPDACRKR